MTVPTGVVLAGGLGRRMGGASKPAASLGGEPLVWRPLRVLGEVCPAVVVVCKADTRLPSLPAGVARWEEPDDPRHPLTGLIFALERAGRPVLVCAADMPFVSALVLRRLIGEGEKAGAGAAVVAFAGGRLEPLLGLYRPGCLALLRESSSNARLTTIVEGLEPVLVAVDAAVTRSVNTPEELRTAEASLLSA